jgi:MFS family permease
MVRQLLPVSALLFGSALLLFAGGINALILPVRGTAEGFSALSLGLLGAGFAAGYILGCLFTPRLVGNVGHIRAFGAMCALAAVALLGSLLLLTPWAWVPLRAVSGFCFAGAAMIVESWLSERADAGSRGRIFGVYSMVNLVAATAGQMVLTLGDPSTFLFFVVGAIFYCLALLPTAMTSTASPRPLVGARLDLRALWRNSPVAVGAVLCVGISNSAFGSLSAIYANGIGLLLASVALFASLPVMAGAISQLPIGYLSDRIDRRKVLIGVGLFAIAVDLAFLLVRPDDRTMVLALGAAFGAAIYAMYPVIIAHANDHAAESSAIQISGGLLLLFGIGSIFGPLVGGAAITAFGENGLFIVTLVAHVLLVLFTLLRVLRRAPVLAEDKGGFVPSPASRPGTPETAVLAVAEGIAEDAINEAAEAASVSQITELDDTDQPGDSSLR